MAIGVQTDMATPRMANHGSKELREEFLAPAIAGIKVACIGVSEPQAGSDVSAIKTWAREDGDDYIINGQKMWITNAIQADFMTVLVNTGDGDAHRNKSLIVIPVDTPGVVRAAKLDNQVVHFRLAEMKTEIELFRALLAQTVTRYCRGVDVVAQVSMLKLKTGRLYRQIVDGCLQYYGGMGFMSDTLISRRYRDSRLASIGGGADEVMLSIIAKSMGIASRRDKQGRERL